MRTKYIITFTNPDDIDGDDVHSLADVERFTSLTAANRARDSLVSRTNADVYVLEVNLVSKTKGTL